jgi:hypothetical protein
VCVLSCFARIVNPEIGVYIYSDVSREDFNTRYSGIIGLVIAVVAFILNLCK